MKTVEEYISLNYPKTVYLDEDGDYIVEVQDLPGCVADGRTPDEAFANAKEAMKSWITSRISAGLDVPEPRTESYSGKLLLRMPKSLHEKLDKDAHKQGSSLNQYIVSLLSESMGKNQVASLVRTIASELITLTAAAEHKGSRVAFDPLNAGVTVLNDQILVSTMNEPMFVPMTIGNCTRANFIPGHVRTLNSSAMQFSCDVQVGSGVDTLMGGPVVEATNEWGGGRMSQIVSRPKRSSA